jgi:hypothetical protein
MPIGFLEAYQHLYGGEAHRQHLPNHPNMPKHPLNEHSHPNITNKQENVKTKNLATP